MGVPASITSRTVKYCFTVRFVFIQTKPSRGTLEGFFITACFLTSEQNLCR